MRFFRQRNRILGALGTPLVFWLLIGSGFGASFRPPMAIQEMNYLEYSFPGTVILILLFTAIFSTISVIEDRREGFLQSVLVAPIPRYTLVLGKILGGTALAVSQGLLFLLLAPTLGISLRPAPFLSAVGILSLVAFGLTGLGFLIAWRTDSTQGFHAIMNLFLIPMWLLSGAVFPASGAPTWLRWVMKLNPLTYGVAALRRALYPESQVLGNPIPSSALSLTILLLFGLFIFWMSVLLAGRQTLGD